MKHVKLTGSTTSTQLIELCNELGIILNKVCYRDQIGKLKNGGYIINLHKSTDKVKEINHWTSFWVSNKICYYFDSFGLEPFEELIKKKKILYYNTTDYQNITSGYCGEYCCLFLYWAHKKNGIYALEWFDKNFKHYCEFF